MHEPVAGAAQCFEMAGLGRRLPIISHPASDLTRGAACEAIAFGKGATLLHPFPACGKFLKVFAQNQEGAMIGEGGQIPTLDPPGKRALRNANRSRGFVHRIVPMDFDSAPIGALRHRELSRGQ